jgi:hypothetical protein
MPLSLPVPDQPASRQQITLDDVPYSLVLTWNERAGAWVLGLENRDGDAVILGRRVVLQIDLFSGYRHLEGVPTGSLFALDRTGKASAISRTDLISGSVALFYYTKAEIDAF